MLCLILVKFAMHITKLLLLWIMIFSAALIWDTKETEEEISEIKRNAITQRYQQNGGFSSGGQSRRFFQNGQHPQNRFTPRGQSLQNKRFSQSGKSLQNTGFSQSRKSSQNTGFSQDGKSSQNTGFSQGGKSSQNTGFSQGGKSSQNTGFSQGGKSLQNTGFSQGEKSSQTTGFSQGGKSPQNTGFSQNGRSHQNTGFAKDKLFPHYRSDSQTKFVPSGNIIPHDMLILSEHNPSGKVDGGILIEGDIVIPGNTVFRESDNPNSPLLWENAEVYYVMDYSVDFTVRNLIWQAMNEWEKSSCIRFINGCRSKYHCVRITTQTNLCSSLIGSAPEGQDLKLAPNCHTLKIVRHELGHVLGFYHEQSRYDRDKYIHINKENLLPNTDTEFNKYMDSWGTEYDYSSIMQYDAKSFSNDRVNKNTMVTPNPHYQTLMGNSKGISFRDKYRVNKMYACSAQCPNKKMSCLNGGYMSPYKGDGQHCQCTCPPRITGQRCENKPLNYEYYDVPTCSMNVTQPTILKTPGYPHRSNPPEKCSYWIQAPKGRKVLVSFQDFSFADRGDGLEGPNKCYYEKVEIRNRNIFSGDMYCAEDLKGRTFTSISENFIMIIDTEDNTRSMRGLKAVVTFV